MVSRFHTTIREFYEKIFPEKTIKLSIHDKNWFTPDLKVLYRKMQREYAVHRRSVKFKALKRKFQRKKREAIREKFDNFVTDLKSSDPGKWYGMAKNIGALNGNAFCDYDQIHEIKGLSDSQAAEVIAEYFSKTSNEYSPLDTSTLPAFLPAPPPPQVTEIDVYNRVKKMKKCKSVNPVDIPWKLRAEVAPFISAPLTHIFNTSLKTQIYPSLWKLKLVTPIPKVNSEITS